MEAYLKRRQLKRDAVKPPLFFHFLLKTSVERNTNEIFGRFCHCPEPCVCMKKKRNAAFNRVWGCTMGRLDEGVHSQV